MLEKTHKNRIKARERNVNIKWFFVDVGGGIFKEDGSDKKSLIKILQVYESIPSHLIKNPSCKDEFITESNISKKITRRYFSQ